MNLKENTGVSFHAYILWSLFRELYMVHQQPETHFTSKQPHHSQCPSCLPLSSSVSCSPSRHELTAHNQAEQALMKVLILLGGHAYPRAAVKRAKESSLSQVHVIGNSMWTNKRQIDLWVVVVVVLDYFLMVTPLLNGLRGERLFFCCSSKDELLFAFMIPLGYNWAKKNRTDNEELGKIRQVLYILQKLSLQVPKIQSFEICRYKEGNDIVEYAKLNMQDSNSICLNNYISETKFSRFSLK